MTKADLYRITSFEADSVLRILQTTYQDQAQNELNRIVGFAEDDAVKRILRTVYSRLPEISVDCDIADLVFDCVRKEAVILQKQVQPNSPPPKASLLREAKWSDVTSREDDTRIDLLMLFLTKKQRKYFLDRYYYFRENIRTRSGYEFVISRLINGKGIASFRFRELKIPRKTVRSDEYVDYLNRLNGFYLGKFNQSGLLLESPRIIDVPGFVRVMERHHRIAIYAIPISCIAVFLMLLFARYMLSI